MSSVIQLPRNVQFLYEEHLARVEFAALGCTGLERDGDQWNTLRADVNGSAASVINRSAYAATLDGHGTVYAQLIRPNYQGGEFNRTRSVNQYLTHWIYPYRGKFHPQMVRALLNVLGVRRGSVVLEPYLGSGTTAVEASLLGADFFGVDLSPLCALLTRVKTQSVFAVAEIRSRVGALLDADELDLEDATLVEHTNAAVSDFVQIARMVTFSDVARRGRDATVAFRKNLAAMLQSVEAYALAVQRFDLPLGRVRSEVGDCRDLAAAGVADASIDAIVTSPPYSIALDYVKNDEHALDAMGVDTTVLRALMTGVRGRGAKQKLVYYNEDMRVMFREVARVLKPGARAAFVIGDATVDGREYTTTEQMSGWAADAGLVQERAIPKIVYGLYSVMSDEKILIFRRP
jgi:hypothetical protein